MKKIQSIIRIVFVFVIAIVANAAFADNYLHIETQTVRAGATANVPIYMTNSDQVVAVQFDVTLPFNMPEDGAITLTSRAQNHSVSSSGSKTTYKVLIASTNNKAIRGNSGILLRIPTVITDNGSTSFPVTISNIVLADKTGKNIATTTSCEGTLNLARDKVPNLTVSNVAIQGTTLNPGGNIALNYTVNNAGDAATMAGWTAKIYMESTTTGEKKFIGSQAYTNNMAAGTSVTQSLESILPAAMRMDGSVRAVVEVIPQTGCGELVVDQSDNTGYSAAVVMTKQLTITPQTGNLDEARYWYSKGYSSAQYYHTSSVNVTLLRSGDCSVAEAFSVSSKYNGLFELNGNSIPCTVIIPAGSSSVTFSISSVDDKIVRASEDDITFTPAQEGYNPVSIHLNRTDDDTNPLSLTLSATEITEGQTINITATRGGELFDELDIPLTCTAAGRFKEMPVLHFDPNSSTCTVQLTSIDDDIPQLDKNITFTANASYYQCARTTVKLFDNDRPTITVTLSPSVIAENAGSNATTATLTRKGLENQAIRVRLWTSNSELFTAQDYVTIPAGSNTVVVPVDNNTVQVPVGITNNTAVDGSRTHTLTAAMYLPADGCLAPSGDRAYSTASVEVVDDESPYLSLSTWTNAVGEGSSCRMRVTRHVASYAGAMTVSLSAQEGVTVPATVTIPSGQSYVDFTVSATKNTSVDDDRFVTITASATNMGTAPYNLRITDRTLPDATITSISYNSDELYAGCRVTISAFIANVGNLVMYEGKTVKLYYTSSYRNPDSHRVATVSTTTIGSAINPGENDAKVTFNNVTLPDMVGNYYLYAKVESPSAANEQEEFSYANNTSPLYQIFVKAPFQCTSLVTDKNYYLPGEFIHVTGTVEGRLNGQKVLVSAKGNSRSSSATASIDDDGNFETNIKIDRSAYGIVTLTANAIGQTESAMTATVHVYNMRLYSKSGTTIDCNVGYSQSGTLVLQNLSDRVISGLQLVTSDLPYGMELDLDAVPTSLQAGQSVEIGYTINPTVAYATRDYSSFSIKASSAQPSGLDCSLNFRYICHATTANIAFSSPVCPNRVNISNLNTTIGLSSTRTIEVTITNYGLKETGELTVSLPKDCKWATLLSQERLSSLAPGQSVTVYIQMTSNGRHSGERLTTQLYASPDLNNGSPNLLTINATVVGTEYSKFTLSTEDVYSLVKKDYSKLSGGTVTLYNTRTGRVAFSGTIDGKGVCALQITQGSYRVQVEAERHKKVSTEFSVGPGEDMNLTLTVPYYAVVTSFETRQDIETNEYILTSNIDIDYDAPQGIVIPTLDDNGFKCGKSTDNIVIQNVGKYPAYNPELNLANYINGISLTVLNGFPSVLYPGEKYTLQVAYEGPEQGTRRYIGIHNMNYSFDAGSTSLSETDHYQQLLGCDVMPSDPDDPDAVDPEPSPLPIVIVDDTDGEDYSSWIPLPSVDSYSKLTFEDLSNIKVDTDVKADLEIKNGSGKEMTKLRFIPTCEDPETYDDLSDMVTCKEGTPTQFTKGTDGYYTLADQGDGILPLIYSFSSELTKDGPRKIIVGGQVAYYCNGMQCTQMLNDYEVTLNASGKIKAVYLVQRNIFADDVETTDNVEASKPAELVMIVRNEGKANEDSSDDVIINNEDLDIVSNATFKPTPYQGLYASRDGVEGNYDYFNAELGKLTTEGIHTFHWMNVTDEMAHVNGTVADLAQTITNTSAVSSGNIFNLEVENVYSLVRSVSSQHNQDMTDVADLNIADRDYTVQALTKTDAYLLDLEEDDTNTPDAVMQDDGSLAELTNVSDNSTWAGASGTYTLTVSAGKGGWIYGEIQDPTNGVMQLEKVVRQSDNAVVAAADFWQTDKTVMDDYSAIDENLLHFADYIANATETYILTYVARPNDKLRIVSMKAYTEDGTEVANGSTTAASVKTIRVSFNKAARNIGVQTATKYIIDEEGIYLSADEDVVTCLNTTSRMEWEINLRHADIKAGKHEFTVIADNIKEYPSKLLGEGSSTITWTEDFDQKVNVTVAVASTSSEATVSALGSVNMTSGSYSVGTLSATATPAYGWKFAYWTVNGEKTDDGATLTFDLREDSEIKAYFTPNVYELKVTDPENGEILGNAGFYTYYTPINLSVKCYNGYCPDYWLINGQKIYEGQSAIQFNIRDYTEVSVVLMENTPTGIIEVTGDSHTNDNVYTLSGMKLSSKINKPGLYIVNGKKMVIRK